MCKNWECQDRSCAFKVWLVAFQVSTEQSIHGVTFAIHRTETKEIRYLPRSLLFSGENLTLQMTTSVFLRAMRFNLLK